MRLNYYRFPEDVDSLTRLDEGCAVHWKTGEYAYPSREVLEKHLDQVHYIDDTLGGHNGHGREEAAQAVRRLRVDGTH